MCGFRSGFELGELAFRVFDCEGGLGGTDLS